MKKSLTALFLCSLCLACPKRLDVGPDGEGRDPAVLLGLATAAEARVRSVKGQGKLRIESTRGNGLVTIFVAAQRPGFAHLESLDFFGKPLAVLTSDGTVFGLYQADEGTFYRGPASPQNLARFLPVPLGPEELVGLLLGEAPRLKTAEMTLRSDLAAREYAVELTRGTEAQTVWFDPRSHRETRSEKKGAYSIMFSEFASIADATFPKRIALDSKVNPTQLELHYTDVELNEPLDRSLFQSVPAQGVTVVDLDADGRRL